MTSEPMGELMVPPGVRVIEQVPQDADTDGVLLQVALYVHTLDRSTVGHPLENDITILNST